MKNVNKLHISISFLQFILIGYKQSKPASTSQGTAEILEENPLISVRSDKYLEHLSKLGF